MDDDRTSAGALRVLQLSELRWQAILDTARDAIMQIVVAHGGHIGFERLSPTGTTFYVDLPSRALAAL